MGKYIEVPDTLAETLTGDEEELAIVFKRLRHMFKRDDWVSRQFFLLLKFELLALM